MQLAEVIKILKEEIPLVENQEDLRYTNEYAALETEQQKLTSLYGEKPDYLLIIKNGVTLLQQGAGHFMVLTALAHAMIQQYSWPGFIESLGFLNERFAKQWEGLYPATTLMKGRVQPMNWWVERAQRYMDSHPISGLGKDFSERALQALKTFDETCQQYFADEVNLMTLIRPFEDNQKRLKLEEEARAANQKLEAEHQARLQEAASRRTVDQTLEQNAEAISTDEYLANMNAIELHILASERLMAEQLELLKENPFEFAIYKHNRAEMWWRYPLSSQELLQLIDEQGLNWEAYTEALKLKSIQNYPEALIAFEALSHQHPFFLDLQLHIYDCLEELGAEARLLNLIKLERQTLCEAYPDLETAKINNEYVVCSKQAKSYFKFFEQIPPQST